jgi:CysZ protein
MSVLGAFQLASADVRAPAARSILVRTLVFTVAAFVLLAIVVQAGIGYVTTGQAGWIQTILDILGGLATLVVVWLLFPAVATLVAGTMIEGLVDAVEKRHYPDRLPDRSQSWLAGAASGVRFALFVIALNVALLPVYLVLLFVPLVAPMVFLSVNGYLLGREYFEMVAHRHLHALDARDLRKANRGLLFLAGVIVALLFAIPLVNFFAPMLGAAAMVHLFHRSVRP